MLSLVLLTGYGGQVSLCQLTFAGMGAFAMGKFLSGSGGVFGPSVCIGGMLGGAVGQLLAMLFPAWGLDPAAFSTVVVARPLPPQLAST